MTCRAKALCDELFTADEWEQYNQDGLAVGILQIVQRHLAAAVAAERERCANELSAWRSYAFGLSNDRPDIHGNIHESRVDLAMQRIAAAIRRQP